MLLINSRDEVILDGQLTPLEVSQGHDGTVVYDRESRTVVPMPVARYALAADNTPPGAADVWQLEAGLRRVLLDVSGYLER